MQFLNCIDILYIQVLKKASRRVYKSFVGVPAKDFFYFIKQFIKEVDYSLFN